MKRISTAEVIVCLFVIIFVGMALAPCVARVQRSYAEGKCQSNLRRWAEAMELYLTDHQNVYPTNRAVASSGAVLVIMDHVPLSYAETDPETGLPITCQYGIVWVEALYPYVIKAAKESDSDWESFMQCPSASTETYPPGFPTSRMTYVFNRTLAEKPMWVARNSKNLVMVREMDRRVGSMLRPLNDSTGSDALRPSSPFLTAFDARISRTGSAINSTLHANGSYVVFADGHVRYFDLSFYPDDAEMSNIAMHWDPESGQWYNWYYPNPSNDTERMLNKSIAITP